MVRLIAAAAMVAAGVVALIEAHLHAPTAQASLVKEFGGAHVLGLLTLESHRAEWSGTLDDTVRVIGIVLCSVGGSVLIVGLSSLARRAAGRSRRPVGLAATPGNAIA